jgi:hypothetical protein
MVSTWQVDLVRFYEVYLVRQGGRRRASGAGSMDLVHPLKVDQVHPNANDTPRSVPVYVEDRRLRRG